jgi:hypothetical protein
MTKISELDQERLLLILEQLHVNMNEIIQINLIRYALLEERIKRLELSLPELGCDRASQSTGDSL